MSIITKDQIIIEKYFSGLFTPNSKLFTDNNKWVVSDGVLKHLSREKARPVLIPGAPFVNIEIPGNNVFFCQLRVNGLSYSDSGEVPFGKFCEDAKNIAEIYQKIINDTFFNKMGIVFYFRINTEDPIKFMGNFMKVNISGDNLQSDFHINFQEKGENNLLYNFNINLAGSKNQKVVMGAFDINTRDTSPGNEVMTLEQMKYVYEYAYEYFFNENKFIKIINNK
jgi:hypothetical protein